RDAQDVERSNMLDINGKDKVPYVAQVLGDDEESIFISATDYMKSYSEQISPYLKGSFKALGTDGFGRSDSRANLRSFFEVDADFIVFTTLSQLVKNGKLKKSILADAMKKHNINPDKINPLKA
ncbi:MAG: transketolase-like TK C-terminal-containing protein, partial [Arcobacter sp.]